MKEHFVVAEPRGADPAKPSVHIVQNWYEEFPDHEQD